MKTATFVLAMLLGGRASGPPAGETPALLTFEQAWTRAQQTHGLAQMPDEALRVLENPRRFDGPLVRAEGSLSNLRSVDVFQDNLAQSRFFSAILTVDYPLLDGGASAIRRRAAMLDAKLFRQRTDELSDALFDETVDAVARLYAAQERLRLLRGGFERALGMRERAGELLTVREISSVTAAQWQDEAIAAETELIELELQRLDAETRLKQLIGDATADPIELVLDLSAPPTQVPRSARDDMGVEKRELAFEEARAARRPQVMVSAFGGLANEDYALYGLRVSVALPMFDAATQRREAQARIEAVEAERERSAALDRLRQETSAASLNTAALGKRIQLLERAAGVAKQRAESVARLTSAGLRSESALAGAAAEVARRESELLAARVELWRLTRRMRR